MAQTKDKLIDNSCAKIVNFKDLPLYKANFTEIFHTWPAKSKTSVIHLTNVGF